MNQLELDADVLGCFTNVLVTHTRFDKLASRKRASWLSRSAMARSIFDIAADEVRTSDAVVLMGAGVSFASGMPLAGQLSPLIWHTLDRNPLVFQSLCSELGVSSKNAKAVVGDDWERIRLAFRLVKGNATACQDFKRCFCALDRSRGAVTFVAHNALARLVHAGRVVEVISFNWDTMLESAFMGRFGFEINGQRTSLWKPHGDCNLPDAEWIFPHEDGLIPASLHTRLDALVSIRPRVLLIVGYSERDEAVVNQLIRPLDDHWRVFRIGPTVAGTGAIQLPADVALAELADRLTTVPDVPGWTVVTFDNQRGIEAALSGERLGPRDVEACPRLPHFNGALEKVELLHAVEIAGDSGSGKSITVWQLAHEYHQQGWQVLRLDAAQPSNSLALDSLKGQIWKTVAVVDDSQIHPSGFLDKLRESASMRIKVILGTTDPKGEKSDAVRASSRVAVEVLGRFCRSNRTEILPLVRQLDSQVGDGFMDVRIETRIETAEEAATPWQFAFVLRGGARKVQDILNLAHDFNRADLLLALIAMRQLATLDAGSSTTELISTARLIGRDDKWILSALDVLTKNRAVLVLDAIRCLHLQAAGAIVNAVLNLRKGQDYAHLVTFLQCTLQDPTLPLRGKSWLLWHLWSPHYETVIVPSLKSAIVQRCMLASTSLEIRDASFVLECMLGRREPALLSDVLVHQDLIRRWIMGADATNAYAVGCVLNNLHNCSVVDAAALVESLDVHVIAEKIGTASLDHGFAWGYFIGRMCIGKSNEWRAKVASLIDREKIRVAVKAVSPEDCEQLPEYIQGVAYFDFNFGLELMEVATPMFAEVAGQNSLGMYKAISDMRHWLLGEGLFFDSRPTQRQRKISYRIFQGLIPSEVVQGILSCRYGEWENYARLLSWVKRANMAKHRAVVSAMEWERLDDVAVHKLEKPPRELELLLSSLIDQPATFEPSRTWLKRHSMKIREVSPRIAVISPETAVAVLRAGGQVNLATDHEWSLIALALASIAKFDEDASKTILISNAAHLAEGLSVMSLPTGLPSFLKVVGELPELIGKVLGLVNITQAKDRWPKALLDERAEVRKDARETLKIISENHTGDIGRLASLVLKKSRYRNPLG